MRKLPAPAQEERRRRVVGLRQAGMTYDAIAAQVGLSRTGTSYLQSSDFSALRFPTYRA